MVIHYLDAVSITSAPLKTHSPLIVDANAILACPCAGKFLKAVGRWNTQVIERRRVIDHTEFTQRDLLDVLRQPPRSLTLV